MIKRELSILVLGLTIVTAPVWAQEELMTKLYFQNWLRNSTAPLQSQLASLKTTYAELDKAVQEIRSYLTTVVKVTIGQKAAYIDEQMVTLDVAPINNNGRTMVPVRFIGEALGAQFAWDEKTRKVTYIQDTVKIDLFIGKTTATVNGKSTQLDAPPFIAEGRTMVPLRFVSQHMGATVDWDNNSQSATIFR